MPVLWRYTDLKPYVQQAARLVRPEDAGRRVVMLVNPGRKEISAACGLLYTGIQIMESGECASSHRHMASALRFIMEGRGAYTVVDGERITLDARDFVLTPNGTWHEHGVDEEGTQCIWQDGLDIPLMNALDANFFEVHKELRQKQEKPTDSSFGAYGGGFLVPSDARESWNDGILMEYINPLTGGPVMPTIGASMQMLRPGERTKAHRHTGSFVYQVAKGRGCSIVDGKRFDWQERDIFAVPSWSVHEHANASEKDDACLFAFHDLPVMRTLGIYAEQAVLDGNAPNGNPF